MSNKQNNDSAFSQTECLQIQAVRLPIVPEESAVRKQTELVEELGNEDYAMSTLLLKLVLHR